MALEYRFRVRGEATYTYNISYAIFSRLLKMKNRSLSVVYYNEQTGHQVYRAFFFL